ncbi:hypothetical protein [Photobacterium phosphoreum]|uniref:hypothetical protein n=1 Tax=Photobacterium phosphoreum TaxID=659 RepID=UPI0007F8E78E|nr:hypothetical protein [Photobacterium phosphoreum]OBU37440.1 hypothetical protein AYY24_11490 [Photobacterium phosphoreum]PSW38006.1 hypothetical protein CTM87_05520 [Photobacterium phosphoreum]
MPSELITLHSLLGDIYHGLVSILTIILPLLEKAVVPLVTIGGTLGGVYWAQKGQIKLKIIDIDFQRENIDREEKIKRHKELVDDRKNKYISFVNKAFHMNQKYIYDACNPSSQDYIEFTITYNELQFIAPQRIRKFAYKVYSSVNEYILFSKNHQNNLIIMETCDKLRAKSIKNIAIFQALTNKDIIKYYQTNDYND